VGYSELAWILGGGSQAGGGSHACLVSVSTGADLIEDLGSIDHQFTMACQYVRQVHTLLCMLACLPHASERSIEACACHASNMIISFFCRILFV
jgi:hypothetical protein